MSKTQLSMTLERLVVADLSARTVEDLIEEIGPLTRDLQVTAPRFEPGIMLFRGRPGSRVEHRDELTYPPPDQVALGRANRDGSPVFYGATFRSVVFFEVPNTVGDQLLVSRWRTVKPLLVNHLGYTATVFERLGSGRDKPGWDGENDPLQGHETSRHVLEQFGQLFASQDTAMYKLTAALAEFFMRPPLEGLIYPTIAMNANADNVALKPEWVDSGLEFVGVELVRIDAVRGLKRDITVLDYATAGDDGVLDWKGRGPNWQLTEHGQELHVSVEQGVYVARDPVGKIVDPS